MNVTFLTVGKPTRGWSADAVQHYTKFLSKYTQVSVEFIKATSGRNRSDDDVRQADSERLLQRFGTLTGALIICDSQGRAMPSEDFATVWREQLDAHGGHAVIVIGGACGVDRTVLDKSNLVISFGPMTLPHDLALLTAMEQVARAFSIARGESYHK